MEIFYTPNFARMYKKLPGTIKDRAEKALDLFKANSSDPRLNLHKLHGELSGHWAFSVDFSYRIIFRYGGKDEIYLMAIGDHDIYE